MDYSLDLKVWKCTKNLDIYNRKGKFVERKLESTKRYKLIFRGSWVICNGRFSTEFYSKETVMSEREGLTRIPNDFGVRYSSLNPRTRLLSLKTTTVTGDHSSLGDARSKPVTSISIVVKGFPNDTPILLYGHGPCVVHQSFLSREWKIRKLYGWFIRFRVFSLKIILQTRLQQPPDGCRGVELVQSWVDRLKTYTPGYGGESSREGPTVSTETDTGIYGPQVTWTTDENWLPTTHNAYL